MAWVLAYFAMSLSFVDKDFKENKTHNCPDVEDHSVFRRRKSCNSMEEYSSSCFCATHFTQKNRSWQVQVSRILSLQSTYATQRVQLQSRNSRFSDKILKRLWNFKMPPFFKNLRPALLQIPCRLMQRALTTTRESGEASREGREDAISGPFAD